MHLTTYNTLDPYVKYANLGPPKNINNRTSSGVCMDFLLTFWIKQPIITLRPRQNGRSDKTTFVNEICSMITCILKFVPRDPIDHNSSLV